MGIDRWSPSAGLVARLVTGTLLGVGACTEGGPEAEPGIGAGSRAIPEARDALLDARVSAADLADWDVRLDDAGADQGGFRMIEGEDGWTIETGPTGAAIAWRATDLLESPPFAVRARVGEVDAPAGHAEGYGIFVGGRHLDAPDVRYTYFLVRGTGEYLVKRREGDRTETLVDWTASDAIEALPEGGGSVIHELEARVAPDSTRFMVDGSRVATLATERVDPYGFAGLRVNHRLGLRLGGFEILGSPPQGAPAASPDATP